MLIETNKCIFSFLLLLYSKKKKKLAKKAKKHLLNVYCESGTRVTCLKQLKELFKGRGRHYHLKSHLYYLY